jgi:hypothetical protein
MYAYEVAWQTDPVNSAARAGVFRITYRNKLSWT